VIGDLVDRWKVGVPAEIAGDRVPELRGEMIVPIRPGLDVDVKVDSHDLVIARTFTHPFNPGRAEWLVDGTDTITVSSYLIHSITGER
jgi:hypothetical protein